VTFISEHTSSQLSVPLSGPFTQDLGGSMSQSSYIGGFATQSQQGMSSVSGLSGTSQMSQYQQNSDTDPLFDASQNDMFTQDDFQSQGFTQY
jgi:hypothetical protein